MHGFLELVASADSSGRSFVSHRSFSPPFFISKGYTHQDHLQIQIQQAGPGLLGGDQAEIRVEVLTGAHLALISPSALRLLPRQNLLSVLKQKIIVRAGACFESWPEPIFPHRSCLCQMQTDLEVGEGGVLFWFEALAPGRTAAGESFAWKHLDFQTRLTVNGRLQLWERFNGRGEEIGAVSTIFSPSKSWSASFYAFTGEPGFGPSLLQALEKRAPRTGIIWGLTQPISGLTLVKSQAAEGHQLREWKQDVIRAVHSFTSRQKITHRG